jgi:hypothetical protein
VPMVPAISLATVPTMSFLNETCTEFWKGPIATCQAHSKRAG